MIIWNFENLITLLASCIWNFCEYFRLSVGKLAPYLFGLVIGCNPHKKN